MTSSEAHPHPTQQQVVTSQPWVIDTNIVLDLWLFEDPLFSRISAFKNTLNVHIPIAFANFKTSYT